MLPGLLLGCSQDLRVAGQCLLGPRVLPRTATGSEMHRRFEGNPDICAFYVVNRGVVCDRKSNKITVLITSVTVLSLVTKSLQTPLGFTPTSCFNLSLSRVPQHATGAAFVFRVLIFLFVPLSFLKWLL